MVFWKLELFHILHIPSFFLSIAKDGEIQSLVLHYLEQVTSMKYGDIYTDFAGQSDIFINNIDHIVISESPNPNSVVCILYL